MWAIVPVKPLEGSKRRLAPALSAPLRRDLQIALVTDLLEALRSLEGLEGVLVVTSDPEARRVADEYGALCLEEPPRRQPGGPEPGLNAALAAAFAEVERRGGSAALVLPGDLASAGQADLAALLASLPSADRVVAVVPDRHADGTNALFCRPPGLVAPAFGPRSSSVHLDLAGSVGAVAVRLQSNSLALDLDTPEDLLELEARGAASRRVAAVLARREPARASGPPSVPITEPESITGDTP